MSYFKKDIGRINTGNIAFTEEGLKHFICNNSNASVEDKRMLLDEYERIIIENYVADKVHNELALTGESLKAHNDLQDTYKLYQINKKEKESTNDNNAKR